MSLDESETSNFVSIESPFSAPWWKPWEVDRNVCYAQLAARHATAEHGENVFVPHLTNTRAVVNGMIFCPSDQVTEFLMKRVGVMTPGEVTRERIFDLTDQVRSSKIDKVVVYTDLGESWGVRNAIEVAKRNDVPVERRQLPESYLRHLPGHTNLATVGYIVDKYGAFAFGALVATTVALRFRRRH